MLSKALTALFQSQASKSFQTLLFVLFLHRHLLKVYQLIRIHGPVTALILGYKSVIQRVITLVRRSIPGANSLVQKETQKTIDSVQKGVCIPIPGVEKNLVLPSKPLTREKITLFLNKYAQAGHIKWELGKVSGTVYHGGKDLSQIITEAFSLFCVSNVVYIDVAFAS